MKLNYARSLINTLTQKIRLLGLRNGHLSRASIFAPWPILHALTLAACNSGLAPQPDKGQRGHNGGVWEWSSTPMDAHEGYLSSRIYPGYSKDFFDGLHHVVVSLRSRLDVPRVRTVPESFFFVLS